MLSIVLIACLVLLHSLVLVAGQGNRSVYERRVHHSVAVIKDRLYIDGGLISNYINNDEIQEGGPGYARPVSNTTSIPLNLNWKKTDINPKVIEYGDMPEMENTALWVDKKSSQLLRWGGKRSDRHDTDQVLWTLALGDGTGAGEWFDKPAKEHAPRIHGSATTCADIHLYFGGYESNGGGPIEGVLTYNTTSGEWKQHKDGNGNLPGPFGTHTVGQAICLEGFTKSPLVVLFGGRYANTTTKDYEEGQNGLETVYLYDPINFKWYNQTTTNAPELGRDSFCSVGAKGQNGTYEIYMFGGDIHGPRGDVCILTLPGFHWVCPEGATEEARLYHVCAIAGERQMISVGGATNYYTLNQTDTWAHNIGILDLPSLSWKDSYDANAGPYVSPEIIKKWYGEKENNKVQWAHPEIEAFFSIESNDQTDNRTNNENGSSTDINIEQESSPDVGTIVGGAIGGLAFVVIILAVLWWYRRHRHRGRSLEPITQDPAVQEPGTQELGNHEVRFDENQPELALKDYTVEQISPPSAQLDTGYRGEQLDGIPRSELDGVPRTELHATISHRQYKYHAESPVVHD